MEPQFDLSVRELPGVHIVALRGELDMATAKGLAESLTAIAGSMVVVDLAGLTFVDTSGITALVIARNQITRDGDRLVLARPSGIVRRALEVVGLADWIEDWSAEWTEKSEFETEAHG